MFGGLWLSRQTLSRKCASKRDAIRAFFFVVVEYLERNIHNIAWSLLRCGLSCKGKSPVPVCTVSAVLFGRSVVYIVTVRSASENIEPRLHRRKRNEKAEESRVLVQ